MVDQCSLAVKKIYISRKKLIRNMEIGIVSSFAGAKGNAGAMWIHYLMILQAVMKEAQVSSDVYLSDTMPLRDGDWNRSFIYTV